LENKYAQSFIGMLTVYL